jgi:hypothetical protein
LPVDLHGRLPGAVDDRMRGQRSKGGGRSGCYDIGGWRWRGCNDADAGTTARARAHGETASDAGEMLEGSDGD